MKIHFRVHYRTKPEETLHAIVYREHAAAHEQKINIPLKPAEDGFWEGEILLLLEQPLRLNYHYEVRSGACIKKQEWMRVARILALAPNVEAYYVQDIWRDAPAGKMPEEDCFWQVKPQEVSLPVFARTLQLRMNACPANTGEVLICGSVACLGAWNPHQAQRMQKIAPGEWAVSLDVDKLSFPFEYKFLIQTEQGAVEQVSWEENQNRVFRELSLQENEVYICSDLRPVFALQKNK